MEENRDDGPLSERVGEDATWIASREDPSSPSHHAAIGKVVGKYRLRGVLGHGGMGTVFEATHTDLGKRVAIKVLSESFNGHPQATARFLREARAASAIESEHIAQVFDVGEDPSIGLYMILELLKGEDLARTLSRGPLRPEDAAGVAWQVCLALERAHDANIVHRDLKPANVFLTRVDDGSLKVKVLDFGIAKLLSDAQRSQRAEPASSRSSASREDLTQAGLAVGTPQYMSPEQVLAQAVDRRTDVYSLGAVIFESIAGRAPYPEQESVEETMRKILSEPAPRLSSVVPASAGLPPALDALVAEMMARDPADRVASASDVRARLRAIYPGLGRKTLVLGGSVRPPAPEAVAPPARTASAGVVEARRERTVTTAAAAGARRSRRWAVAAGFAATLVVVGAAFVLRPRGASPATETASAGGAEGRGAQTTPATLEETIDPTELIRAAERALARGDARRARELATTATRRTPERADAWLALGAACEAMRDGPGASAAYAACASGAKDPRAAECSKRAAR